MNKKRWAIISAVAVAVVVAIAAVVLWAPRTQHRRETGPGVVETPTVTTEPTATTEPTNTTSTVEPTASTAGPQIQVWRSAAPAAFTRAGGLWVAREDGRGRPRRVADFGDTGTYLLSPDRKKLAYTKTVGRKKPLYVIDLSTGTETNVAADTDALQGFPYAWSPASDRIAFTAPVYSGSAHTSENIYTVRADGSERRLLAPHSGAPAWGPGDRIAFRTVDVSRGTWRVFATGKNADIATLVPSSNQATSYGWAPNRADLAFTVTQSPAAGGVSSVWMMKEGETSPQPIFQDKPSKAAFVNLAWSPDGRLIAVDAGGDDGFSRVRVMDAGLGTVGTASWQVQKSRDDYLLGWSADATRLLYFEGNVFQGAPSNLWTVKRNGTSRRLVVPDAAGQ